MRSRAEESSLLSWRWVTAESVGTLLASKSKVNAVYPRKNDS